MNRLLKNKSLLIGLAMLTLASCSNDNNSGEPEVDNTAADKYFLAGTSSDGTTTFTYTMAVKDLAKDTLVSTNYPGTIENMGSYTQWGYSGTKALFAISYQQGNPAPGSVFQLSAAGALKKIDDFVLDKGFNTIGSFSHYLVAAANGETLTGANDGKKGSVFYSFDLNNNNAITQYAAVGEGFVGGDQIASFVGIADAGNDTFFTAVNLAIGPSARPVNADSIYVAKMDAQAKLVRLYKDNRLSASGGQFRSARYGQLANDADGNTYVFSTGYGTTTKKSGALLIKKDATAFDAAYYFNIEEASGGYKLRKVWNITADYFLLEMYNTSGVVASTVAATQYAVARMSTKDFKWVRDGFPTVSEITSVGWPFTADGKAYISAVTPNTNPTVYVIDPITATAKKGISVSGVSAIPGMGKLSPQSDIK
ncbi:DUF4374 domain-containing protein [Flavobacterium ajazii]|uniref:DUF4374 domain-containing protein n=1 Tax=Flavobacterium ajazii TaxID=2692318 RepID=UPI0013D8DFC9|nr:DUF4374 domain-containing protein [Flavobacterium ajazii]